MRRDVIESNDPELNKSKWPDGPWKAEPDRVEWRYGDVPCLLVRNRLGAWCGYAGVYPGHPWHGQSDYDALGLDVHGGLTYADECADHVCHVPREGEPTDHVWWLGFDCAHYMDLAPGLTALRRAQRADPINWGDYRDKAYAMENAEEIARAIIGAKP